jgi:hypothetical protein
VTEYLTKAEAIVERFLRKPLGVRTYKDFGPYDKTTNFYPLTHKPLVEVLAIKARAKNWFYSDIMGESALVEIPLKDAVIHRKDDRAAITLPPSIYGTPYDEIEVEYTAGLSELPADLQQAINEVADDLKSGKIDDWNCILPIDVIDVIDKYREEA